MTMVGATRSAHEILGEFPAHFLPIPDSPTYEEATTVAEPLLKPFKFPLFQLTISGRTYLPSKPIGTNVTQDGAWFFAENEALNVVGTGGSLEEAVLDLEHHIVHFWQYYRSLQDSEVTGDAIRLKKLFSKLLVEAACEAA
jgi:hypothetical protein